MNKFMIGDSKMVILAVAVLFGLFVWHSRPGRAVRHGMFARCHRRKSRSLGRSIALMTAIAVGLFVSLFHVRTVEHSVPPPVQLSDVMPPHHFLTDSDGMLMFAETGQRHTAVKQSGKSWAQVAETSQSSNDQVVVEKPEWKKIPLVEVDEDELLPSIASSDVKPEPDWVKKALTKKAGQPYRVRVESGPYTTHEEVERGLDRELREKVAIYVNDHFARESNADFEVPLSFINDRLVVDRYDRIRTTHDGLRDVPMFESLMLLEFNDASRKDLEQMWRREVVSHRLWHGGIVCGLVLTVLGTVYSYLRLDTLSKGYYTFRLRAAAAAVITLAALVGGCLASGKGIM